MAKIFPITLYMTADDRRPDGVGAAAARAPGMSPNRALSLSSCGFVQTFSTDGLA
jgi:hypothetical protein